MARAVLTDIEGTTSSIAFVKETLFPYARSRMGAFVRAHADEPAVAAELEAVRRELGDSSLSLDAVVAGLEQWIDEDRKATPLKSLQGLIWRQGYIDGDYQGHVYSDAILALRQWHAAGFPLFVYSSGSVAAQKLLFGYSVAGDLTPLFAGYFDTRTGPKKEAASYRAIVEAIRGSAVERAEFEPADVLFLSDVVSELDAARAAGLATTRLVRPEDGTGPGSSHREVATFAAVII